jgi:hypothetical protein
MIPLCGDGLHYGASPLGAIERPVVEHDHVDVVAGDVG